MSPVDAIPLGGGRKPGRRELRRFIDVPKGLYPPSSRWVAPLDRERLRFLDPERNPFFSHAEAALFIARDRRGRDAGRIAAIKNPRHPAYESRRLGFFGFFDAPDDPEVSGALIAASESWLRERGHGAVHGPVNPSTNHECGLLVSGFDLDPRVQMPYNHRHYENLLLEAGYRGVQDLVAYEYRVDDSVPPRLERAHALLQKRGSFELRPVNRRRFGEEIDRMKLIYREAWAESYGFVPPTDEELDWLARELRPLVDPDLCLFAEVDGEPAGVMLILPDVNQALRSLRGRLFPLGWWKLIRGLKKIDAVRALIMGVRPRFRKLGIDYAYYRHTLGVCQRRGYRWIELSWILDDNTDMLRPIHRLGARETKRYRLYEKELV